MTSNSGGLVTPYPGGWRFGTATLLAVLAGCSAGNGSVPPHDLGTSDPTDMALSVPADSAGCSSLFAQVGFSGCPSVTGDGGVPLCTGPAPLAITLVPLTSPCLTGVLWTVSDGGLPASSQETSPQVSWALPGHYDVHLAVKIGSSGSGATASAEIEVTPARTGGLCSVDAQCGQGDDCRCTSVGDGGVACPAELSGGLCTRACTGGSCGDGQLCIDFSRSTGGLPDLATDPYRHPLCLPSCKLDADCRTGFTCRDLPALVDRAGAGGAITWRKACFASFLGDSGHSCIDSNLSPSPGSCLGGVCAPLGLKYLCTQPCGDLASNPCSPGSACAKLTYDPAHPICLARCDGSHPCTEDTLLDCESPDPVGWYGFTVTDSKNEKFCAPKRCALDADCPGGRCVDPGMKGGARFCQR